MLYVIQASEGYAAHCSEYGKGKAQPAKCRSSHPIDMDIVMENIGEIAEDEALECV